MLQDYFDEAHQIILDAKKGIAPASLSLIDSKTGQPWGLNSKIRIGDGIYLLIFGNPGTGKTSLVDMLFVLNPILHHIQEPKEVKPRIIYRAMERPPVNKIIKFIAYLIYYEYDRIIDVPTLCQYSSRRRLLCDKDIYQVEAVKEKYADLFDRNGYLDLKGGVDTPQGIKEYLMQELLKIGTLITSDMTEISIREGKKVEKIPFNTNIVDKSGNPYLEVNLYGRTYKISQKDIKFFKRDSVQLVTINDTINKLQGVDDLKTLNEHSRNVSIFRDLKAIAMIDIAQMGRETEKVMSSKSGDKSTTMYLKDVKGTGDLGQNADIVAALVDPSYFEQRIWSSNEDENYDCDALDKRLRILQIIKNSESGPARYKMPLYMLGENSYFYPLPNNGMNAYQYDDIKRKFQFSKIEGNGPEFELF